MQIPDFLDANLLAGLAFAGGRQLRVRGLQRFGHDFPVIGMCACREPAATLAFAASGVRDRRNARERLRELAHEIELAYPFPAAKQQCVRKGGAALQQFLPLRLMPRIDRYRHSGSTISRSSRWMCSIDAPASITRTRAAASRARRR